MGAIGRCDARRLLHCLHFSAGWSAIAGWWTRAGQSGTVSAARGARAKRMRGQSFEHVFTRRRRSTPTVLPALAPPPAARSRRPQARARKFLLARRNHEARVSSGAAGDARQSSTVMVDAFNIMQGLHHPRAAGRIPDLLTRRGSARRLVRFPTATI